MTQAITIALPKPPSTNNLFVNVPRRGRVISNEYDAWREAAGWDLVSARPGKIKGQVSVEIAVEDKGNRDLDNCSKAILDLLVTHGVIEGDSRKYVRNINLHWEDIEGVRITVKAEEGA